MITGMCWTLHKLSVGCVGRADGVLRLQRRPVLCYVSTEWTSIWCWEINSISFDLFWSYLIIFWKWDLAARGCWEWRWRPFPFRLLEAATWAGPWATFIGHGWLLPVPCLGRRRRMARGRAPWSWVPWCRVKICTNSSRSVRPPPLRWGILFFFSQGFEEFRQLGFWWFLSPLICEHCVQHVQQPSAAANQEAVPQDGLAVPPWQAGSKPEGPPADLGTMPLASDWIFQVRLKRKVQGSRRRTWQRKSGDQELLPPPNSTPPGNHGSFGDLPIFGTINMGMFNIRGMGSLDDHPICWTAVKNQSFPSQCWLQDQHFIKIQEAYEATKYTSDMLDSGTCTGIVLLYAGKLFLNHPILDRFQINGRIPSQCHELSEIFSVVQHVHWCSLYVHLHCQ